MRIGGERRTANISRHRARCDSKTSDKEFRGNRISYGRKKFSCSTRAVQPTEISVKATFRPHLRIISPKSPEAVFILLLEAVSIANMLRPTQAAHLPLKPMFVLSAWLFCETDFHAVRLAARKCADVELRMLEGSCYKVYRTPDSKDISSSEAESKIACPA